MRDVPEDEAQEVRELLHANDIEFFETSAGNWGISMPALWLKRADQFELSRQLLDEYQAGRSLRMREEYELSRKHGEAKSMRQNFIETPFRFSFYLALIGLVLYLSIKLFLWF